MRSDSYQAVYDLLAIISQLEDTLDGVTQAEVHLIAYLSCLLSLYGGHAAADWGYGFVRTEWGAPYAYALADAADTLRARGFILLESSTFRMTEEGTAFLAFLKDRAEHAWRTSSLNGACGSVLALPVGTVRSALQEEPSLKRASLHRQARLLLSRGETDALHDQFQVLSEAVGPSVDDLLVPSVVWLSYLAEMRQKEDVGSLAQSAEDAV